MAITDSITSTTKKCPAGYANMEDDTSKKPKQLDPEVVSDVENETKADPPPDHIWVAEVMDALKSGLKNEYDEGSWGLDIEDEPSFEDVVFDNLPEVTDFNMVRLIIGKQKFLITVKEVPSDAEAERGTDPE